jgi:hypothetical protein
MYEADMLRYRQLFKAYNTNDLESVQKWLADYSYLSVSDLARMSGKSIHWVRTKRRQLGLNTGNIPPVLPKASGWSHKLPLLVPEDWQNKEWLQQALMRYLPYEIAEAVGVNAKKIKNLAFRWGLKRPGLRVRQLRNPYFTYAWCYEHYIEKGWSQIACSKVAGVCQQTFSNWLVALNIPVRYPKSRSKFVPLEIWTRELVDRLEKLDCVRRVFVRHDHIHVRFMNFFWESYFFRGDTLLNNKIQFSYWIDSSVSSLVNIPKIELKYQRVDGSDDYGHLCINTKQYRKSSFMEKRVAIHDFAWQMCRRGYVAPRFPENVLALDFQEAHNAHQYEDENGLLLKKPPAYFRNESCPGFKVITHFFGMRELWDGFISSPRKCVRALNLIVNANVEVNTFNLMRYMTRHYKTPMKELGVGMYVRLFEKLHFKGVMHDLCPGYGFKAMACAVLGIKYVVTKSQYSTAFEKAIDAGYADFLGLDFEWHEEQQANILMCDDDLKGCDFAMAKPHIRKGVSVVFFAKDRYKFEKAGAQPVSIIPIGQCIKAKKAGYFFVL